MRADAVTAYGAQALAEGSHGEVDVGLNPGGLGSAATGGAQYTHGMGLVHQQVAAILALYRGDLLQRRHVAQHGVNALGNDQGLVGTVSQAPHAFGQVVRIVVLVADDIGAAEGNARINAGVAVRVQQDHLTGAGEGGAHAHGGGVAGGKNDGVVDPVKSGDFAFQRLVFGEGAVGQARPGSTRAPARGRRLGRGDAARVVGQAQVVVGAGQDDLVPFHHALGGGENLLGDRAEGRHLALGEFGLEIGHGLEFVKQHGAAP